MLPNAPVFSSHNDEEEPWRLTRLVRTDARVRELLRILTPEEESGDASMGERIWVTHVVQLHDDRGRLRAHVSEALGNSGWLSVIALVLARAWNSEDESDIDFMVEGEPITWPIANVLSAP